MSDPSGWIEVSLGMPRKGVAVDLWIEGEESTVRFYDPTQKRGAKSGRTTNWGWDGQRWCCIEGLTIFLSIGVVATHWMYRPPPPDLSAS